jgi:radical SAM protein with 4Fe4S-binding SPASM domain
MTWAETHGVSVRSVPFSPIGRGRHNRHLQNGPEDVEKAARFWLKECEWEHEYHRRAGLCVGSIFNYGLTLANMSRRCSSGRYLCYVAADGTVFPCTMCAAETLFSPGSVASGSFGELWKSHWEIRDYSWDNFSAACSGCVINDPAFYCASRCPAMSFARHGSYFECGASEFEILSTLRRTELLSQSPIAQEIHRPAVEAETAGTRP